VTDLRCSFSPPHPVQHSNRQISANASPAALSCNTHIVFSPSSHIIIDLCFFRTYKAFGSEALGRFLVTGLGLDEDGTWLSTTGFLDFRIVNFHFLDALRIRSCICHPRRLVWLCELLWG